MRRLVRAGLSVLCALLLAALCLAPALADFGDFDTGGDYGGFDSDYDSYDGGDYGSGSGGVGSALGLLILLPFYFVVMAGKGAKEKRYVRQAADDYRRVMQYANTLTDADPAFDREALQAWVRSLYRRMQESWEKGDISDLKREFDPSAWSRFNAQLCQKISDGYQGHVRDIRFIQIEPFGWCTQGDVTWLDVHLKTNIISWNTRSDGSISTGSQTEPKDMEYYWRLRRPADARTDPEPRACPGCGATNGRLMAFCHSCGAEIERDPNAWVISDITGRPITRV